MQIYIYVPYSQITSHSHSHNFFKVLESESWREKLWKAYSLALATTKVTTLPFFIYHSYNIAMSSFAYLVGSSSSLSLGFREDMFSNNLVDPCQTSLRQKGVGPSEGNENNLSRTLGTLKVRRSDSIAGRTLLNLNFSIRAPATFYPLTPILLVGLCHIHRRYP